MMAGPLALLVAAETVIEHATWADVVLEVVKVAGIAVSAIAALMAARSGAQNRRALQSRRRAVRDPEHERVVIEHEPPPAERRRRFG